MDEHVCKKNLKFLGDQCLEASHQIICRSLKIAESHCIVPYNDGSLWEGYGIPSHREAHIPKHFASPVIWLFQPVFHFQRNLWQSATLHSLHQSSVKTVFFVTPQPFTFTRFHLIQRFKLGKAYRGGQLGWWFLKVYISYMVKTIYYTSWN